MGISALVKAPSERREIAIQCLDPIRIVGKSSIGRNRRPVVGLEVVAEFLWSSEVGDPHGSSFGVYVLDAITKQLTYVIFGRPTAAVVVLREAAVPRTASWWRTFGQ